VTAVDAAVIRRKLGHIVECLEALRPLARLTLPEYRARLYERKAAERLLQEGIEAALDINAHMIAELGGTVPDEYYGGFVKLGELGVLSPALAEALAPSAGLRNRLVHEYGDLDDARVLEAIAVMLDLYPRYIGAVQAHLSRSDT
jgi:uncharacterized protein YutE (UPF0331/DUF86 family)